MRFRRVLRHIINAATGITLAGIVVGYLVGGRPVVHSHHGLVVFLNGRFAPRFASAITIGDIVISFTPSWRTLSDIPVPILRHEAVHAAQYAWVLGFAYFPLYWLACGISLAICGDHWSFNPFERNAHLGDGGYSPKVARWAR